MPPLQTIGVIGLGLVGSALAKRLRQRGLPVIGYDIDSNRATALEEVGVEIAARAADVAARADQIVFSLPTSAIGQEVANSIGDHWRAGTLVVDTTTGKPDEMIALCEALARRGVGYVDACIVGSSAMVASGEATVLVGGEADDVEQARPIFEAIARRVFPLGPVGSGARMKLVVNLVLGLNRAVLAEGLAYARATGIDPAQALEVLMDGVAYSRVMETKGKKMIEGEFEPQAKLAQHAKDVRLILSEAERAKAVTPFSALHARLLEQLCGEGYAECDNAAIIRAFLPKEPTS